MSFTWTLNWDEIRKDLVIGSCPRKRQDLDTIQKQAEATALFSLQEDSCHSYWDIDYSDLREHGQSIGLEMSRCPMRDMDPYHQGKRLFETVRALHALIRNGNRVYVHCTAGMGRAPLTVVGYLNLIERMPMDEAFHLVKSRRSVAVPSPEAMWDCRRELINAHYEEISNRAYLRYKKRQKKNRPGDSQGDWAGAEAEVLSEMASAA